MDRFCGFARVNAEKALWNSAEMLANLNGRRISEKKKRVKHNIQIRMRTTEEKKAAAFSLDVEDLKSE